MARVRRGPARRRRGVALVAALGLLMLGAALLAGSAMASVELRRATRGRAAAARAQWEGWRALGEIMRRWDAAADSLPVGGVLDRVVPAPAPAGPPVAVTARLRRLTARLYAATVTVSVHEGEGGSGLAMRRLRLLLERSPDSVAAGATPAVVPLARWSVVDRR